MAKWAAILLIAATALPVCPAMAATALPVQKGEAWVHAGSNLTFPANADGFARDRASDLGSSQSELSFAYYDAKSETSVTLYIFRAGIPDVSIWADRAEAAIVATAPHAYGNLDMAGRKWTRFSPWPNSTDAGLRITYGVSGMRAKATGLTMIQHGDWLIKVRMTSGKLNAAQLDARLMSFLAALAFPAPKNGGTAVYAMKPCADALPDKNAEMIVNGPGGSAMAGALTNSLLPPGSGKPENPGIYCRDQSSQRNWGVYRPNGAKNSYVLALGDGGNTMLIGPDAGMKVTDPKASGFSVTLITTDRIVGFPSYDALPPPSQVIEGLNTARPTYMRSRLPGQENKVQIVM